MAAPKVGKGIVGKVGNVGAGKSGISQFSQKGEKSCSFPLSLSHSCGSRYSVKGTVAKQIFILNKNIVHLIDDMFWLMGFKTESQAEKVILI